MAIVVIGGLITSTFLSRSVIPVLYKYVDDAIVLVTRLARRRQLTATAPASSLKDA
jgi:Cu/Ag efflux pump CusA